MAIFEEDCLLELNRRECLGGIGLGGIALAGLLAEQDALAAPEEDQPDSPLSPRPPHFRARAKNVIFLFMVGGASHLETFDYKPKVLRQGTSTQMCSACGPLPPAVP